MLPREAGSIHGPADSDMLLLLVSANKGRMNMICVCLHIYLKWTAGRLVDWLPFINSCGWWTASLDSMRCFCHVLCCNSTSNQRGLSPRGGCDLVPCHGAGVIHLLSQGLITVSFQYPGKSALPTLAKADLHASARHPYCDTLQSSLSLIWLTHSTKNHTTCSAIELSLKISAAASSSQA